MMAFLPFIAVRHRIVVFSGDLLGKDTELSHVNLADKLQWVGKPDVETSLKMTSTR